MFFYSEPIETETIPNDTISTDDGLYLLSEEGLYIIFD